jgi:hypothetical protein
VETLSARLAGRFELLRTQTVEMTVAALHAMDTCLRRKVFTMKSGKWIPDERVDPIVHRLGQGFYFCLELIDWLFRRVESRSDTRAVRRSHHLYYVARRHYRRGELSAALSAAQAAFTALDYGERRSTFVVMGVAVVILMEDIAHSANRTEEIRPELAAALGIFRDIQADPHRCSVELDQFVEWLSRRVGHAFSN